MKIILQLINKVKTFNLIQISKDSDQIMSTLLNNRVHFYSKNAHCLMCQMKMAKIAASML